jgi:sec-independent protein translocase protein TatA
LPWTKRDPNSVVREGKASYLAALGIFMPQPLFAFNMPHGADWLYLLLIVLVLFGANKLPQLARGLGRSLGEFKKAKDDFDKELHSATSEPEAKSLEDKNRIASAPSTATTPVAASDDLTKKS